MMKKGKPAAKKAAPKRATSKPAAKKTASKKAMPMMKKGGKMPKKYQDGTVEKLPIRQPGVSGINARDEGMYLALPPEASYHIWDKAWQDFDNAKTKNERQMAHRHKERLADRSVLGRKYGGTSKKSAPKRMAKGGKMKGC